MERGPGNWPLDPKAAYVECRQKLDKARKEAEHWRDNHKTLKAEIDKMRQSGLTDGPFGKLAVYAILRIELGLVDPEQAVAVKEIVPTLEDAEVEVDRLNQVNANKRCKYVLRATRFFPSGRQAERISDG